MLLEKGTGLNSLEGEELVKYVRECFTYCKESGELFWSVDRPMNHFIEGSHSYKLWNTRCKGKDTSHISHGYRITYINGKKYRNHRLAYLIVEGKWPEEFIDHVNGNRSDNSWSNIRGVTHLENCKNLKKSANNSSGVNGVCWDSVHNKWRAYGHVTTNGKEKHINLGRFLNIRDAESARLLWEETQEGYTNTHGKR